MMQSIPATVAVAVSALVYCCSSFAQHPDEHANHGSRALGEVRFATTCVPKANEAFNRALLYQHSFWYRAARQNFEHALKIDATCAVAHWGIAQSLLLNPFASPPPENLQEGLTALHRARALATGSQRERDFISALLSFFTDHDKRDHRSRVQAYLRAMEELAARYPDDDEAQIFYALALNLAAPPDDKTYALQLRAAGILEPIFRRRPRHPGVAHYLVHSYDFPGIAEKGIEAAKRYAEVAGDSPHALHMPSHIFTRVGYWGESIEANLKSARVARKDKEPDDELHAMDYLVYAYLQRAMDDAALRTMDEMKKVVGVNPARHTGPFALAASTARYYVEREDWKGAAAITLAPTRFPHADAITYFARSLGAARGGSVDAAREDWTRLAALRDALLAKRDVYWAEQVGIQCDVAEAWILYAQGRRDEALRRLAAAADAEDKTEKHVVTPGPLAPAREMYASMLLSVGRAAEATDAFEATLRKEPRRMNATLGAARAAEQAGMRERARQHYKSALSLADATSSPRRELAHAKAFLSSSW